MIYIALLRGINVSGQKKILMSDLKIMFENLGFSNVKTYIQSGNVIFSSEETNTGEIAKKIEEKIKVQYGFDVPVLILTGEEIKNALAINPYLKEVEILETQNLARFYVTFLSEVSEQKHLDKIDASLYAPDRFTIMGKNIYLHVVNGYGETKLSNNFFESKLKVKATTRNWKTVQTLNLLVSFSGINAGVSDAENF